MRRFKTRLSNRKARDGFVLMLLIATLVGVAGCLGTVVLVITPETTVLGLGESVTFTAATPTGTPVTGVTWTISSGSGTIDAATGVFTAPSSGVTEVTTAVITATKGASTGTATVVIKPPVTLFDDDSDTFTFNDWSTLATGIGAGSNYEAHLATLTLPQTPTVTYDVTKIDTSRTATALNITLTISPAPTLATAGSTVTVDNFAGFIDLDTDENSATGAASANTIFCQNPPTGSAMGSDFFVSLFARNADGTYNVFNSSGALADQGNVTVSTSINTVTLSVPLTALGGDDGRVSLSAVFGNGQDPNDCAPDEGGAIVTITDE